MWKPASAFRKDVEKVKTYHLWPQFSLRNLVGRKTRLECVTSGLIFTEDDTQAASVSMLAGGGTSWVGRGAAAFWQARQWEAITASFETWVLICKLVYALMLQSVACLPIRLESGYLSIIWQKQSKKRTILQHTVAFLCDYPDRFFVHMAFFWCWNGEKHLIFSLGGSKPWRGCDSGCAAWLSQWITKRSGWHGRNGNDEEADDDVCSEYTEENMENRYFGEM